MSTVGALVIGPSMLEGKASVVAYRMPPMPTSVRGSSSSVSRRLSGNSSNSPSTGGGARLLQVGSGCARGTVGRSSAGCETRQSASMNERCTIERRRAAAAELLVKGGIMKRFMLSGPDPLLAAAHRRAAAAAAWLLLNTPAYEHRTSLFTHSQYCARGNLTTTRPGVGRDSPKCRKCVGSVATAPGSWGPSQSAPHEDATRAERPGRPVDRSLP
eukprot:scaffold89598_cov66-Phaeocystis_antarctica.AAC.3